jgi:hypothetical protein
MGASGSAALLATTFDFTERRAKPQISQITQITEGPDIWVCVSAHFVTERPALQIFILSNSVKSVKSVKSVVKIPVSRHLNVADEIPVFREIGNSGPDGQTDGEINQG